LRSGLITGDFTAKPFPGHERRGAGKRPPRGVTRKRILRQKSAKKKSYEKIVIEIES